MTKRKTTIAAELVELVALVPWWLGVTLAVISYVWMHAVATAPVIASPGAGQLSGALAGAVWKALATALQYIVPVICLAGAAVSAWRRHERQTLLARAANPSAIDGIFPPT